jgi:hypothetical protein
MKCCASVWVGFVVLLFTGCSREMTGIYESDAPSIPRADFGASNPQMEAAQAKMQAVIDQVSTLARIRIEFAGSKVRVSTGYGVSTEYSYDAFDDHVDLPIEANGVRTTVRIEINKDGSLTYMGLRFLKVSR